MFFQAILYHSQYTIIIIHTFVCVSSVIGVCCGLCKKKDKKRTKKVDGGGKYMVSQLIHRVSYMLYHKSTIQASDQCICGIIKFCGREITLHIIFTVSLQELKNHE